MAETPPDNPPAFPNTGNSTWSLQPTDGMTLRDWFAGQALPAIISATSAGQHQPLMPGNGVTLIQAMARDAYDLADAMLAERAK